MPSWRPSFSLAEVNLDAAREMPLAVPRVLLERHSAQVEAFCETARAYADVADGATVARVSEQFLVHVPDAPACRCESTW